MSKKQLLYFFLVFALLLAGRLAISGRGYLDDQDEFIYYWLHAHAGQMGHSAAWVDCMFDMQGQPPEILIRLAEYLSVRWCCSMSPLHPHSLWWMGIYNILASLAILFVFYRILLRLRFDVSLALTGTWLLGTLVNYNLYTRHILPYDHALLFQLLALYLLLSGSTSLRVIFVAGLLSALGTTTHYGTFMFFFINAGYLVLSSPRPLPHVLGRIVVFILPFILLVAAYEALTQMHGRSYLSFLTYYTGTLAKGASYEDGFRFIFLYFSQVEHIWGLCLLAFSLAGTVACLLYADRRVQIVVALGIVGYLSYAISTCFLHKTLFIGRVLHIYYPFVIISVLYLLSMQRWVRLSYVLAGVFVAAGINYLIAITDLNQIGYPRTVLYEWGVFEKPGVQISYYEEMPTPASYGDKANGMTDSTGSSSLTPGRYIACNFAFLYDGPDSVAALYRPLQLLPGDSVVREVMHFESHPAYGLEYCTRSMRAFYQSRPFRISLIRKGPTPAH